jgi:hypothetical protein
MDTSWAACQNHMRRFAGFLSKEPAAADIYATVSQISDGLGGGAAKVLWTITLGAATFAQRLHDRIMWR